MFRKIVSIFLVVVILVFIFWLGNTTIKQFGKDIEFKRPSVVLAPLFRKVGLDISATITNTDQGSSGPIDVSADDDDDTPESFSPQEVTKPEQKEYTGITLPEIDLSGADFSLLDTKVTKESIDSLVSTITISTKKNGSYNRDTFEKPVQSYTIDGKTYNRREYALLTSEYLLDQDNFTYKCPYTGILYYDKANLDYDHIIPLGYVAKYSDQSIWTAEKCNSYSYSQDIGVCVSSKANRSKSDKGPADWLPDVNIENYCYTWLCIASEWNISLREEDLNMCKLQCLNAINSGATLVRID